MDEELIADADNAFNQRIDDAVNQHRAAVAKSRTRSTAAVAKAHAAKAKAYAKAKAPARPPFGSRNLPNILRDLDEEAMQLAGVPRNLQVQGDVRTELRCIKAACDDSAKALRACERGVKRLRDGVPTIPEAALQHSELNEAVTVALKNQLKRIIDF